jgi:hypothetical protein
MTERRKLSDILSEGERKSYFADWNKVKAAGAYVVPKGEYVALLTEAGAHKALTGTKGIKLVFEIVEGEHTGRKLFHDLWLTAAAKTQTKRDLDEVGIADPERQLDGPIPQGIVVALIVTVRKDDAGIEQNRIRRIKFLRVEPGDAFEPPAGDADQDGTAPEPSPNDEAPTGSNGTPAKPKRRPKRKTKRKAKDASAPLAAEGGNNL